MQPINPSQEKEFWDIIEFCDWENSWNQPSERTLISLLHKHGEDCCYELREFVFRKKSELSEAWDKYNKTNSYPSLSDNEHKDLIYHTIGLGATIYYRNLADPSLLLERAKSGNYKVSFSYLIPTRSHSLKHYTHEYYGNKALELLDELSMVEEFNHHDDLKTLFDSLKQIAKGKRIFDQEEYDKIKKANSNIASKLPRFHAYQNICQDLIRFGDLLSGEIPRLNTDTIENAFMSKRT